MDGPMAYVTFLMRGDGYLPGALTLAYALRCQETPYPLVCLVTGDVSQEARRLLSVLYHHVLEIGEIRCRSHVTGGRTDRDSLLTRFQALRLGMDGDMPLHYKKILLLDADVLPITRYDSLFDLCTPAGILLEDKRFAMEWDGSGAFKRDSEGAEGWCWHRHYRDVPHGALIPKEITDRVAENPQNQGVNAAVWCLSPNMKEYLRVWGAVEEPEIADLVFRRFPWPEMQLATLIWSGRWTNVDLRYASIGGYPSPDKVWGIHYAGLKPWKLRSRSLLHYAKYPDFQLWYGYFLAMVYAYPQLTQSAMLRRLQAFILENIFL